MKTPIHVLCLNFTEVIRREVGETMRSFGNKKVRKMQVFRRHFAPVAEERATWPYVSLWNFIPIGSDLPELIPKKWFRTITI